MARRRTFSRINTTTLKVSVYDPHLGQSVSFTVYCASLKAVAYQAQKALGLR